MKDIFIGKRPAGKNQRPFLIAEMSGNHNQSLEKALAIVDAAADAGADAIKLQTYTADTITLKGAYKINDKSSLWNGEELYDLYTKAYTPWEWHKTIFEHARKKGLIAFSSPFDTTAVDFLEGLDVPAYKIASFENTDHILLKKVVETGKPLIISTGVSTLADISETVDHLRKLNCENFILLKCTSTYPASAHDSNLLTIPNLSAIFDCPVGLSDHTLGIGVAVASVALGACVIEKHFTLSRAEGGVDSAFSMEPAEFKQLVTECNTAFDALGEIKYGILENEKKSLLFKRSLYVTADIKKGDVISEKQVRSLRPNLGIPTKHFESIIGKIARKDVNRGNPFTWDIIL